MPRPLLCVLLAGLLAGCASMPTLPPKESPDVIRVFEQDIGEQPQGRYRALSELRIERPIGTSNSDLVLAARTEAARLGADAIIIRRISRGPIPPSGEEGIILDGISIYWPEGMPQ